MEDIPISGIDGFLGKNGEGKIIPYTRGLAIPKEDFGKMKEALEEVGIEFDVIGTDDREKYRTPKEWLDDWKKEYERLRKKTEKEGIHIG